MLENMTGVPWPIVAALSLLTGVLGYLERKRKRQHDRHVADAEGERAYHQQGWERAKALDIIVDGLRKALDRGLVRENSLVRGIDLLIILIEDLLAENADDEELQARLRRTADRVQAILEEARSHARHISREVA